MEELIKLLAEKITEITGLTTKYSVEDRRGNTPGFNLFYRGIFPMNYIPEKQKLKTGYLKFNVVYIGQYNNIGDLANYIDNELNLMKLFKYTRTNVIESKRFIDLGDTTNYSDCKLYVVWNDNDIVSEASPWAPEFIDARKTFNLELHFKKNN